MCLLLGQKYDIIVVLLHCCMVHACLVDNYWHAIFLNDIKYLRFNLRKMPVDNFSGKRLAMYKGESER